MVGFLKKGEDAKALLETEQRKADLAEASRGVYRFWLPRNAESQITFLDGDIDKNGYFSTPIFYEHNLKLNGKWGNTFVCTEGNEPCPMCEEGSKAYTAAVFTIIDHTEYVSKKDGKTHKDNVKLLVVKSSTRKDLLRLATKRKGLAGCTFDVSRKDDDKSPAVGDLFDFCQKLTPDQMKEKWGDKATPLDYASEIKYIEAEELRKLLGMQTSPAMTTTGKTKSYDDDL